MLPYVKIKLALLKYYQTKQDEFFARQLQQDFDRETRVQGVSNPFPSLGDGGASVSRTINNGNMTITYSYAPLFGQGSRGRSNSL